MGMEASLSNAASLSLSQSLRPHSLPPNTTTNRNTLQVFNFKPSTTSQPLSLSTEPPNNSKLFTDKKYAFENPRSIYSYIRKLARYNKLNEALTLLDHMDQKGIPVNPTTFSSLIAACTRTKSLSQGRKIHTHLRINGLENNESLCAKLIRMYTSCDALEDAKKLLNECHVYPLNELLLGGTVVSGKRQFRDLVLAYLEMRALGLELNVCGFGSVVKSIAGANAILEGLKVHALLIKNGFLEDSLVIKACLIDMYLKCAKIELARQVFEESCKRDVVWGAMIAGFACSGLRKEALEYVRLMVEEGIRPNSILMTVIIHAIGEVRVQRLGQEVHAYVVKTKLYSEPVPVQSALIDMYCKCGDIGSGRRVLYSLIERNVGCWTDLKSGYTSIGRHEQALRSMIWMQQEGFQPDVVTVATVLPICAQLRALKQGKEIHAYALKHWFLPHVSIISSLMVFYSKCGVMEYSVKLFDGMKQRNVILWTAIIDSYAENGCMYEALGVIRSMQLTEHRPDTVTIARMLSVCRELKFVKLGKEIHGQVLKRDFTSVHYVSAELINMYGTCGVVDKAKLVFDAVPVKGSMTWTALIRAYGYKEWYQGAIDVFDHMISNVCSPNTFTFEAILSICDRAGFVEAAFRIFNLMSRYKIEAFKEHCTIMIRLLTRYGKLDEAERFVEIISSL